MILLVSILLGCCLAYQCGNIKLTFPMAGGLFLFFELIVIFGRAQKDKKGVNSMSGVDFERYVAGKLREKGFTNVRMTPTTGDYGVDIVANKGGKTYAIQCKRYKGSTGVHAVQEVYSGCKKYGADYPVVVTSSKYTRNAKEMADDLGVSLWSLEMLDAIFDD